jgi:hypothetical protein
MISSIMILSSNTIHQFWEAFILMEKSLYWLIAWQWAVTFVGVVLVVLYCKKIDTSVYMMHLVTFRNCIAMLDFEERRIDWTPV